MLERMRELIHEANSEVVEEWKWRGVPVWSHGGILCTGETYRNVVKLSIPVLTGSKQFRLVTTSQGCADAGLCYPPTEHAFRVDPGPAGLGEPEQPPRRRRLHEAAAAAPGRRAWAGDVHLLRGRRGRGAEPVRHGGR